MPVTRHPRTDPYVRNYRIRLLPRMNRGGTACRTPNNPWDTDNARSESGPCGIRTMFSLVHALSSPTSAEYGSSLFGWFTGLRRSPTSPGRTRPSCGLGLHGPVSIFRPRHPGDLPVLVHVVSQRARGLRLRRTGEPLASSAAHRVAFLLSGESRHPGTRIFSKLKTRPADTSVYTSAHTSRCNRKTRGQDGFATSFPVGLFHPLQHAGLSRRFP